MFRVVILDGYIDEPSCLGVPPYISPYPRYIAGAVWKFDHKIDVSYLTIDQIRNDSSLLSVLSKSDLVIVIAGMVVPGRYLSGFPASPNELKTIFLKIHKPMKLLCGPAAKFGFGVSGGKQTREYSSEDSVFDFNIVGDAELVVSDLLKNKMNVKGVDFSHSRAGADEIKDFAKVGTKIVKQHPNFPEYLMCEIETYRGCSRSITGGCSFCSEPSKGSPDFRAVKDIVDEIKALYTAGCRHFRLGCQPCLFSYQAENAGIEEFPRPSPDALDKLFSGIRKVAPNLKTLHIDNVNPGIIARYPEESCRIAKTIIKYHTSGDVAAMGVESVDPTVIKSNNLKASKEEVKSAIKLINDVGAKRGSNGLPELLPGLNFVFGLIGESKQTFVQNYDFLKELYDEGLLLRRINLRQVIPIPNTRLLKQKSKTLYKHKSLFQRFKRQVRENIERPMLSKMIPSGTVVKDVYIEKHDGKHTFGRQLGSYPLLIGIQGVLPKKKFFDVKVVDYGFRSVTGIPFPIDINSASKEIIMGIPGVGKKRANNILLNRPFKNKDEFISTFDDPNIAKDIIEYLTFKQ